MKPIITLLLVLFCSSAIGQLKPDRVPSYFGIQIRPLFPAKYVGDKEHTFSTTEADSIQYSSTITQRLGYSFGVTVRAGLTKLIALETGINFSQRNFDYLVELSSEAPEPAKALRLSFEEASWQAEQIGIAISRTVQYI